MSLLDVKNLTISFGGLVAVDNVTFNVDKGEIVSIIGPNGAGKTTIFNMLTGLYRANAGSIEFDGKDITRMRPQDIVRAGIARTFQNIRLFPDMRVIENIMLGSHIDTDYGLFSAILKTPKFRREEAQKAALALKLMKQMNLEKRVDSYAGALPYGEMRRVEILRAMATGAKLLLLDEPAAGMHPNEAAQLVEFIKEIRDAGFTILLIEHHMNVVMNIADRIYVLDYGKLIAQGLPKEIRENPLVIEAYLGRQKNVANN